jgi:hypothetical protein
MHEPKSHLEDLRRQAVRSRAAAMDIQRALASKLADSETRTLVTDLERRASDAIMQLAFAAESLYLREVIRRSETVLDRVAGAERRADGRRKALSLMRKRTD